MSTLTHAPAPEAEPAATAPRRAFGAAQVVAALPGAAKKLNPPRSGATP